MKLMFTVNEVVQVLKNAGQDTDCGACMEGAFMGTITHTHTCKTEEQELKEIATLYRNAAVTWSELLTDTNDVKGAKLALIELDRHFLKLLGVDK